jgi:hypothetical protein
LQLAEIDYRFKTGQGDLLGMISLFMVRIWEFFLIFFCFDFFFFCHPEPFTPFCHLEPFTLFCHPERSEAKWRIYNSRLIIKTSLVKIVKYYRSFTSFRMTKKIVKCYRSFANAQDDKREKELRMTKERKNLGWQKRERIQNDKRNKA